MNTKIPDLLGKLSAQSQLYKTLSIVSAVASLVLALAVFRLANRSSVVLAFDSSGIPISSGIPKRDGLIEQAIRSYVNHRYQWKSITIDASIKQSEAFILPDHLKSFRLALFEVTNFAKERQVSQRVFVEKILVKDNTIDVYGEKVTVIQGFRAATIFRVRFQVKDGAHTSHNPWGIYIIQEQEEVQG